MNDYIDVPCTTTNGTLYVGSQIMHRQAFAVMDVTPLWLGPNQRGTNLLIPGRPGRIIMPKRADETTASLRMLLDGRYTVGGTPTSDSNQGLFDIFIWLRSLTAPSSGTAVTLYEPDGVGSITGTAQLRLTMGDRTGPLQRALLEVTMPNGSLA